MSRLIGEYLREIGYLTDEQVVQALRTQVCLLDSQEPRLLGEIMVDEGYVTAQQVGEALALQEREAEDASSTGRPGRIFTDRSGPAASFHVSEFS